MMVGGQTLYITLTTRMLGHVSVAYIFFCESWQSILVISFNRVISIKLTKTHEYSLKLCIQPSCHSLLETTVDFPSSKIKLEQQIGVAFRISARPIIFSIRSGMLIQHWTTKVLIELTEVECK